MQNKKESDVAHELHQNIDCKWRPDFDHIEDWEKNGIVVAYVISKTKKDRGNLIRGIDSGIAVKFFGAIDFSFDIFPNLLSDGKNLNFILCGTRNPVFFISKTGVTTSVSNAILDDGFVDSNYAGYVWLKNAMKWLIPENEKDFNLSALCLQAFEDDNQDGYVFYFAHNIKNLVEFNVMSNKHGEGVFCKGVAFNVADLVTVRDDKTIDLFGVINDICC